MVRSISANAQNFLDQNTGTEPALIIEIQWVDGGDIYVYSDKDITSNEGKILEVSGLDNTVVVQGVQSGTSGDSQSISVTLDDTDGIIKSIIDSHDIHKEPAWVYQWFQGLGTSDKFLIFKGQISSPIQWNEGDRTVSFDIITRVEDVSVGFSMEEGNFEYVPEDLVGEPWPLIFGTVKNCKALKTRTPRRGVLKTGFGIRDFMLAPKAEQTERVCCPLVFTGWTIRSLGSGSGGAWGASGTQVLPRYSPDIRCLCRKRAIICEMDLKIAEQSQYEYSTITIIDGELFPQGEQIVLDISGAKVTGYFNGTISSPTNIFTVEKYKHPRRDEITVPPIKDFGCDPVDDPFAYETSVDNTEGQAVCILPSDCTGWGTSLDSTNIIGASETSKEQEAWNYLSSFQEAGFFWAEPGSEVTLSGENELVYEVNLLPSTIHYVKAYRTFSASNLRQLTTVPTDYYSTRTSDFVNYNVAEIVVDKPLSSRGEGWEDDLYVTLTSSVGPNTVDIMEWLITKYTSFTWDSSFTSVKTKIDNYPMHFHVPGRKNILKLLQELAFQARCALTLRDDEFHLTYLAEEPASDGTITDSDVLANSLVLDHTDTEDLVTELIAEWKPSCEIEEPYKYVLRFNTRKYGSQQETFDFYAYNIQELVIKSATFWMIRMANTWKKIICKTPINKLALEGLDGVYVTLPDIADGTIKCRVETATYNSDDHAIDFVLQTPVRSGSRIAFPFHYPADISVEQLHPTSEDLQFGNAGGTGPNVDVEAPEGHVLGSQQFGFQNFTFGQKSPCEQFDENASGAFRPFALSGTCRPDQGDQVPSDTDDVKPTVSLESGLGGAIPPGQSPVNETTSADLKIIENNLQQEGNNSDLSNQLTRTTNTGTGSEQGAGVGDGAGSASDSGGVSPQNSDEWKDYLDNLPDEDELTENGQCWWAINLHSVNNIERVFILPGESCTNPGDPTFNCSGPACCLCREVGKTGCAQVLVPKAVESFYFDSKAERDSAIPQFNAITADNQVGTVGQSFPVYYTLTQSTPPNCSQPEAGEASGLIGHQYSGTHTGEYTIAGQNGFMLDGGYTSPGTCMC